MIGMDVAIMADATMRGLIEQVAKSSAAEECKKT